jgi:hypothetical protein
MRRFMIKPNETKITVKEDHHRPIFYPLISSPAQQSVRSSLQQINIPTFLILFYRVERILSASCDSTTRLEIFHKDHTSTRSESHPFNRHRYAIAGHIGIAKRTLAINNPSLESPQ